MNDYTEISKHIKAHEKEAVLLSEKIWNYAELNFRELKSAEALCAFLEKSGFTVEREICGMKTAFCAQFTNGSNGPVVAYLGEYDALPGLSQKAYTAVCEALHEGEAGHGCGHNLLGAGSYLAACALMDYVRENNLNATIRYYGCPAEEDGSGKTYMAKAGCFNDVSAALTWHPGSASYVVGSGSLAVIGVMYRFEGVASHAAATPFAGRSALDAAELMNVGCNYLREHIIPEARLHYAYRDVGGSAPNVVQASAALYYFIRAPHVAQMLEIKKRVDDIARGACLMSGTSVSITALDALSDYVPNKALSELLAECMREVGAPIFDKEDYDYAQKIANTISEAEREDNLTRDCESINAPRGYYSDKLLDNQIPPLHYNPRYAEPGSTDVGDVSYCAPTAQCNYACMALGTGAHSWQFTSQANSVLGNKGMVQAAQALALCGARAIASPKLLKEAARELSESVPNGYTCPMPENATPEFK